MATPIDHEQFVALLSARLPEVADAIDEYGRSLLHCEMGTLAGASNAAIRSGDVATLRRHFQFADEVHRNATPDVANAVEVSYLEHLALCSRQAKRINARALLSPRLSRALDELEEYLARLFS